jgi:O-antigen/teichoic acid export membrane protein
MFLVPAVLVEGNLGAVLPLLKFGAVVSVPMTIIARTAMKYVSMLLVSEEHGKIKAILRDLALLSSLLSVAILIGLWLSWDFIECRLKFDDDRLLWLLGASVVISCWTPLALSISQGLKHFYRIILARLMGPIARLLVILLLLQQFQLVGYISANLAVGVVSLLLLGDGLLRYFRRDVAIESYRSLLPEMFQYSKPIAVVTLMVALQLAAGPWIIRQRLSESVSAGYYIASMFGNIPMWVAPAMMPFLFPLVSEKYEKGISTVKMHIQALSVVIFAGIAISAVLFVVGDRIIDLRPVWKLYHDYAAFMWQIALITTLDTVFMCHVTHESACREFSFLRFYVPLVIIEVVLLGVFMGWGDLRGVVPEDLWQFVNNVVPVGLQSVITIMLVMRLINIMFLLGSLVMRYSKRIEPEVDQSVRLGVQ